MIIFYMVNRITWSLAAAVLTMSPVVSQAQESVRGLICTIADHCDLSTSSVHANFIPRVDWAFWDTPASLNVNLHCVSPTWLRSTWSQFLESSDSAWWLWEISRLSGQQLIPYILQHEPEDPSWSQRLGSKDFDCEMGNIEIPEE